MSVMGLIYLCVIALLIDKSKDNLMMTNTHSLCYVRFVIELYYYATNAQYIICRYN